MDGGPSPTGERIVKLSSNLKLSFSFIVNKALVMELGPPSRV
jgi:hypothetical protein